MNSWSVLLHYSGVIVVCWPGSTCLALAAWKQLYLIISGTHYCHYHLPAQNLPRFSQIPRQFCSRICVYIHILYMCVLCAELLQSWLTLCDPMDCSPPGSSDHGILQARIQEWVAMPSSRASSWPRDWTHISYVSCISRWVLYHLGKTPLYIFVLYNTHTLILLYQSHICIFIGSHNCDVCSSVKFSFCWFSY